jgi:hypothetical protein
MTHVTWQLLGTSSLSSLVSSTYHSQHEHVSPLQAGMNQELDRNVQNWKQEQGLGFWNGTGNLSN